MVYREWYIHKWITFGCIPLKKNSKDLLPETYEQYKTNFYWEHKKCNQKTTYIQTFNCIDDLLAENERLKKRNIELEIQNLQTTRNWFNDA